MFELQVPRRRRHAEGLRQPAPPVALHLQVHLPAAGGHRVRVLGVVRQDGGQVGRPLLQAVRQDHHAQGGPRVRRPACVQRCLSFEEIKVNQQSQYCREQEQLKRQESFTQSPCQFLALPSELIQ